MHTQTHKLGLRCALIGLVAAVILGVTASERSATGGGVPKAIEYGPGSGDCYKTVRVGACATSTPGMGDTCPDDSMSCPHTIVTNGQINTCTGAESGGRADCVFNDTFGLCSMILANCAPDGEGGFNCESSAIIHEVYYPGYTASGGGCS